MAPVGPLGTLASTVDSGLRSVDGSGYLAGIQDNMRNSSLLALGQSGASGTLVSNVSGLATLMNNISTANGNILTASAAIQQALTSASQRQGALSLAWRDTAAADSNVDLARVGTIASRISTNATLLGDFNAATPGSAAHVIPPTPRRWPARRAQPMPASPRWRRPVSTPRRPREARS